MFTEQYLNFYQLDTTRLVSEKKARLMEYIGISERRNSVNSVSGAAPVWINILLDIYKLAYSRISISTDDLPKIA